jgi:hypothetical protein
MFSEKPYNLLAAILTLLLIGIVIVRLFSNDGGRPGDDLPPPIKFPTPERASQVKRNYANVMTGPHDAGSLVRLSDNNWHALQNKDRVATDSTGEGLLDFQGCMNIYLFHNSELMSAPCSKSEYLSGNVICSMAGTSAFNNKCNSKITIQTDSVEIALNGTWVTVTHLRDKQLTIVSVEEGGATVRPVTKVEGHILAKEPIMLKKGQFCFSTPGEKSDPIKGLPARQPLSLDKMSDASEALNIEQWLGDIKKKAEQDRVSSALTPSAGSVGAGSDSNASEAPSEPTVARAAVDRRYDTRHRILRFIGDKDMSKAEIKRGLRLSNRLTEKWLNVLLKEHEIEAIQTKPVRYRRRRPAKSRRR